VISSTLGVKTLAAPGACFTDRVVVHRLLLKTANGVAPLRPSAKRIRLEPNVRRQPYLGE
jgi:hypothetical protein